jgi:hypothetical protein
MDERADQIEEHINRARVDLNENINELKEKVTSAFDWRTKLEERPVAMLGAAFGGGVLASALLPSGGGRRRRYTDYAKSEACQASRNARHAAEATSESLRKKSSANHDTVNAIKGALLGVAASRLGGRLGISCRVTKRKYATAGTTDIRNDQCGHKLEITPTGFSQGEAEL